MRRGEVIGVLGSLCPGGPSERFDQVILRETRARHAAAEVNCEDYLVVPESIHDFFLASGGAAAALVGLLFVAISVASERLSRHETSAQIHRIRAGAAFTAFTNALAVSLFALIPGQKIGPAALVVAIAGLVFVLAALLSLVRLRQALRNSFRDALFLIGLVAAFVVQLIEAASVIIHPANAGAVNTIAILVVACFLIGVARAWELIGGPSIGIAEEVTALVRSHRHAADDDAAGDDASAGTPVTEESSRQA